ncbi:hypothetical protein MTBBW1_1270029 [Desulfamplus magnetovallimortis]|uniref:YhcG N-terminal domain-containing protein n=1 Tax=Desulfamplus magnetovallimortis TaxID=1246637 RepID=A0A1W1H6U8_9BACT|nr:DUF1016 N-terminal domain-containing protein [Desulfamplus magnetovallimortis]SLM28179.1 hypothetical protein MTBBW1_1270029 [Desulfamplus magnetovallimortis]
MNKSLITDKDYYFFINDIKSRIKNAQIKAAVSVNQAFLNLYWDMAAQIVEKQKHTSWGDGFLKQLSKDLQSEFPDIKGFSLRNLKYMRQWFLFWSQDSLIGQQLVAQIPWGHNLIIMSKTQNHDQALFYVQKTIQNIFLFHLLKTNDVHEQISGATNGSTVNMLSKDGVEWVKFRMPPQKLGILHIIQKVLCTFRNSIPEKRAFCSGKCKLGNEGCQKLIDDFTQITNEHYKRYPIAKTNER